MSAHDALRYDDWTPTPEESERQRRNLPIPGWHESALCKGAPTEDFFGSSDDDIRPNLTIKQLAKARGVCHACPVMVECLTTALCNRERYGVWAGTSGHTRQRIWGMIRRGQVQMPEVIRDYQEGRWSRYERSGIEEVQDDES